MKRTFFAFALLCIATALMAYGSLRLDDKCSLLIKEIDKIIENNDSVSKSSIEKNMDYIIDEFEKDRFVFSCVLGPSESEDVKNAMRQAKNELNISPDEEFLRNMFEIRLKLEQIKKQESLMPQNLV